MAPPALLFSRSQRRNSGAQASFATTSTDKGLRLCIDRPFRADCCRSRLSPRRCSHFSPASAPQARQRCFAGYVERPCRVPDASANAAGMVGTLRCWRRWPATSISRSENSGVLSHAGFMAPRRCRRVSCGFGLLLGFGALGVVVGDVDRERRHEGGEYNRGDNEGVFPQSESGVSS